MPSAAESMDSLPEGSDTKFTFGQHVGLIYHVVMHKDPGYYPWSKDQKSPNRLMANFLDWTTDHCENEVLPRLELLVMCHVYQQGLPMRTRASVVGRNHYIPRWEVVHTTRSKRVWIVATQPEPDVYKNDPATCNHESTDRRHTSRFTARFFCNLCGTHADEMPQEEARRRAQHSWV